MTIDGNTIVWASALVGGVAIVAGAVLRFAKREVSTDLTAVEMAKRLTVVEAHVSRLTALERRVDFVERDATAHAAGDHDAFGRIERQLDKITQTVTEMRDDVTEVLVAARLKDRAGARSDPSKT